VSKVPSVRNNIIANFSSKAWTGILSLAFVPLYIKLMGVEAYGLLGIFMSLTALLSLLDMGLSATLSRELSKLSAAENSEQESRNLVRTFELIYWGVGILIGLVVIVLTPLIGKYWINANGMSREVVDSALLIMGVSMALQWPSAIYSGALMGLQRQIALNTIRSVTVTIQHGGAALLLLYVSHSILLFFVWQAFVGFFSTLALAICLWKLLPKSQLSARFDVTLLIKHWRFASGMMGISLVTILLTQLDKIILSKMLTLEMFGYYMLAFSIANALNNLVSPIYSAIFPKLTQIVAKGDEGQLSKLYHKGCQLLSFLVLPVAITIAIFAEDVLSLWLSDAVAAKNAHVMLTLLMIGTMLNAIMTLPYALQLAHGWTKLALYKNIVAVILLVPLMIWMVHMYQGIGAAWVWIILNLGYFIFEIPIMHKRLLKGEMGAWYKRDIILPIVVVCGIGLITRVILPTDAPKIVILSGISICLVFSFIGAAWMAGYLNMKSLQTNRP
jgi:O-antigen/teichoic acid export membrane protein